MKQRKNLILCLMLMSSILWTMPTIFADPLTREEVDSAISSDLAYPGSEVREFLYLVIETTTEELAATATAAAAEAARPLLVEIAGLEAERDLLAEWKEGSRLLRNGALYIGIIAGGALGYGLGCLFAALRFGGTIESLSLSN